MCLKNIQIIMVCAALTAWSGLSLADEYRPDEFLGLDLSKALLSPKPLGPAGEFAPVPLEARADRNSDRTRIAGSESAHVVHTIKVHVAHRRTIARAPVAMRTPVATRTRVATRNPVAARSRIVARTRVAARTPVVARTEFGVRTPLAHRYRDPLNAQAFDTRIQVWPCRSGGICNWKPQRN
jgi:hypothetical protein